MPLTNALELLVNDNDFVSYVKTLCQDLPSACVTSIDCDVSLVYFMSALILHTILYSTQFSAMST